MNAQQASDESTNPQQPQQGNRGRTRGGRGRGRGRQQIQQQHGTQLPTLAQRAAQVAASSASPIPPLPVQPIALSQLSAIMDAHFPVEMEPIDYVSYVDIDCGGFVDLCKSTYHACVLANPKISDELSTAEFTLCCGQLLTYRVIDVIMDVAPTIVEGFLQLREAVRSLPPIPEPIAQYLEGLGLYRDAFGHTLCPQLVLPVNSADVLVGMIPSSPDDRVTIDRSLGGAMFPFGLLERLIVHQAGNNTANLFDRFDPAQAGANDGSLGRIGTYPHYRTRLPTAQRIPNSFNAFFARNSPYLLNVIRWHTPLFRNFCDFCRRMTSKYSCVPYPTSKAGSPAFTAYCEASDPDSGVVPDSFDYRSYMALTNSEQHAARLFRYRRNRPTADSSYVANDANRNLALTRGPSGLNSAAPLILTIVRIYSAYLDHYTRHFAKH